MDYKSEVVKLEAHKPGEDFWKPEAGQHKVKALSELEDADPYEEEGRDSKPQKKVRIKIGDKEINWKFGIGKTMASTYGQLCNLAAENNNKLESLEFTVVVKFDGTKNDYTIII